MPQEQSPRLSHVGLYVTDVPKMTDFYTRVLGFVVSDRYHGSDGALQGVMLKAGACELGLSQDDWAKGRDRQRGNRCPSEIGMNPPSLLTVKLLPKLPRAGPRR